MGLSLGKHICWKVHIFTAGVFGYRISGYTFHFNSGVLGICPSRKDQGVRTHLMMIPFVWGLTTLWGHQTWRVALCGKVIATLWGTE